LPLDNWLSKAGAAHDMIVGRVVGRLARALVHGLRGWRTIRLRFPHLGQPEQEACVQAWALRMLDILGVGLEVRGIAPAHGPLMLVANHISWLDILVIHATRHCRFVSKSDVEGWPLIGRVVHRMAASLTAGEILAVFPEGTTSDGVSLLPFHGNLVQAAISANAPALPVALDFVDAITGARTLTPCYIGDDTLVGSLWRTLSGPAITARVTFGTAQFSDGRDRRTWARELRGAVESLRRGDG
jgi:1-acyl-sn-glycerol-3-phosphate acyltransferase